MKVPDVRRNLVPDTWTAEYMIEVVNCTASDNSAAKKNW